jgi:hypothetical protein
MKDAALQSWLDKLVTEGKITQEQADEYLHWWQSKPNDIPLLGARGGYGMMWGRGHNCWGSPSATR